MYILYGLFVGVLCIFSLPLMGIISLGLFVTSGFPLIFYQRRTGKNGTSFLMYKFRTMSINAEKLQQKLIRKNESDGPTFKMQHDPRFTRVGRFLSHTGLDELPQLYNVLRGEMALIGPRPLPIKETKKLKPWMRGRQNILPGIISPAILTGTYHKDFDAWMTSDVAYAKQKNILADTRLVCLAIVFLLRLLMRELIKDDQTTEDAV